MGDLKTPYDNPAMPPPDLSGSGVTERGNDPQVDLGGSSGINPFWQSADQLDPALDGAPTDNPVSGLPLTPTRWEPSATSEQPPDLTDRNPGTIDRK